MRRVCLCVLSFVIVAPFVLGAPVAAQPVPPPSRAAVSAYESGLKAIKNQQWNEAIAQLTRAVAADPTPRSYVQGAFRDNYFPQFFLFVAFAKSNAMAKAQQNYNLRGPVPHDRLRPYQPI